MVQIITIKEVLKKQGRSEIWLLNQLKSIRYESYSNLDAPRMSRYCNGTRTTRLPHFYSDVAHILNIEEAYINSEKTAKLSSIGYDDQNEIEGEFDFPENNHSV